MQRRWCFLSDDRSQQNAIYHPVDSSLFVTAPPGYGKTYVMSKRMEYLISKGCVKLPNKLLGLTFSNAAADEMKKRIMKSIPNCDKYIDIMNFHTFAYNVLRLYGNYLDIDRCFTLVNEKKKTEYKMEYYENNTSIADIWKQEYDFLSDYNYWYNKKYLQGKRDFYEDVHHEKMFEDLRSSMNQKFIDKNHLDFDHLLFNVIELLQSNENIKNLFFNKYPILLADEFQDTNYVQYTLFKELATNSNKYKKNVYVVGDKRQAIMKFQGANPDNIDLLIGDFNCEEVELNQNHRTDSEQILNITNKLRDSSFSPINAKHRIYINETVEDEMSRIAETVSEFTKANINAHNICILFPQKKTAHPIKKKFENESIEYIDITDFKMDSIVEKYSNLIEGMENYIENKYNKKSVKILVNHLFKKYYPNQSDDIVLSTILSFSAVFDKGHFSQMEVWKRLQEFYNYLQMEIDWTHIIKSNIKNKVYLSTIHASKGLEFDYIFMLGIVNYRLPHHSLCWPCQDFKNPDKRDISESQDLFYVGVSRAIKDVIFFYCKQDEQNLKYRKISCVFSDIVESINFIDYGENEYDCNHEEIKQILCKPRIS